MMSLGAFHMMLNLRRGGGGGGGGGGDEGEREQFSDYSAFPRL